MRNSCLACVLLYVCTESYISMHLLTVCLHAYSVERSDVALS
jgi:hypothetical protein